PLGGNAKRLRHLPANRFGFGNKRLNQPLTRRFEEFAQARPFHGHSHVSGMLEKLKGRHDSSTTATRTLGRAIRFAKNVPRGLLALLAALGIINSWRGIRERRFVDGCSEGDKVPARGGHPPSRD